MDRNQEMLDEMYEQLMKDDEINGRKPHIKEGDVRGLKRVKLEPYWNNANQISKPVSDDNVKKFLSNKTDKPFTWNKTLIIIFAVTLVMYYIVHGISGIF